MAKLTKAQKQLLEELSKCPHYVAPFYAPYKKLLELGLVKDEDGKYSTVTHLTDAGRAALRS